MSALVVIARQGFRVRTFQPEDRTSLARYANNRQVWRNLRDLFPHPYSVENADWFIGQCMKEEVPHTFCIEVDGECGGTIGLVLRSDIYRHTAEIGYWLGEPFWGRGIATEAVKAIVDYGFTTLDLVRIDTGVFSWNVASMRVLEKAGFVREGVFRKGIMKDGEITDEVRFAILR